MKLNNLPRKRKVILIKIYGIGIAFDNLNKTRWNFLPESTVYGLTLWNGCIGKLCSQHHSTSSPPISLISNFPAYESEKLFISSGVSKNVYVKENESINLSVFVSFHFFLPSFTFKLVAQQTTANEHMRALSTFYNFLTCLLFHYILSCLR